MSTNPRGPEATSDMQELMSIPPGGITFLPGRLLFSKLWGSHSHNCALPESDRDFICIYVAKTDEMLSLNPPKETETRKKPDIEAHEVAKFCRLLLKGNPSSIETLYTERFCTQAEEWGPLRLVRKRFLSHRVILQYLGYGLGQLKRYDVGTRLHTKSGKATEKWCYHMVRVLLDARRIAQGGEPVVFKEGAERDVLMNIRTGLTRTDLAVDIARSLIEDIDAAKPWPWPEEGDRELLNAWLLDIRHRPEPRMIPA